MNRIDRLSAILIMLQSSSEVKVKHIADRFGISRRTVYRDIKALEEAGIPIAGGVGTGYSLVEGFKLPPLMFSQSEAFAFLAAESLVEQFTDEGFKKSYKSGIEKIRAVMRLSEKETMESMNSKIAALDFHVQPISDSQNILQTLMQQIARHKRIEIDYYSYNSQQQSLRKVDPIGLVFSLANWYLIAFCNQKKDYRTFRVSRIKDLICTDEEYKVEHLSLESYLKTINSEENLQEVILQVNKNQHLLIEENKYYQGLVEEKNVGDVVEMRFMIFSIERFARWYLSYVDIARIVHPQELYSVVKDLLSKGQWI